MINFEYDKEADAVYIKLRNGEFARNTKLSNSIILDLDKNDNILGIEIINVNKLGGFLSLFDIKAAANYLNVSEVTVRRWVKEGKIPAYQFGRAYQFRKEELDNFVKAHEIKGVA